MKIIFPAILSVLGVSVALGQDAGVTAPLPGAGFAGEYQVISCTNAQLQPPVNQTLRLVSRMQPFGQQSVPVLVLTYAQPLTLDAGTFNALGGITAIDVAALNLPWVDNGEYRNIIYTAQVNGLGLTGSHKVVLVGRRGIAPAQFTPVTELDEQIALRFTDRTRRTLNYQNTVIERANGVVTNTRQNCVFRRRN